MDTNTLLIVHYSDLIYFYKEKFSPSHNNFKGIKDNSMHCLKQSLTTIVCARFFKRNLIFKMQNSLIIFEFKHEVTVASKVENDGKLNPFF